MERPLQGELNSGSATGAGQAASGGLVEQSTRSNVVGAACCLGRVACGVLVEAGATVVATSMHGLVLVIPAGPPLVRHGDSGTAA